MLLSTAWYSMTLKVPPKATKVACSKLYARISAPRI